MLVAFCLLLHLIDVCVCVMSPKVVGGQFSSITVFPYVAYINVKCVQHGAEYYYGCGSSILNQKLLLTVGHCMFECLGDTYIVTSVGHCVKQQGTFNSGISYIVHEYYRHNRVDYDIALGPKVSRVSIMKQPPYFEKSRLAGWGITCESKQTTTEKLKDVYQQVWQQSDCIKKLVSMPKGTFCASSGNKKEYPSMGDSGSPLVVRGYIQIGLVSFKKPGPTRNVVVYTDVGYFYDWIKQQSETLYCS